MPCVSDESDRSHLKSERTMEKCIGKKEGSRLKKRGFNVQTDCSDVGVNLSNVIRCAKGRKEVLYDPYPSSQGREFFLQQQGAVRDTEASLVAQSHPEKLLFLPSR